MQENCCQVIFLKQPPLSTIYLNKYAEKKTIADNRIYMKQNMLLKISTNNCIPDKHNKTNIS